MKLPHYVPKQISLNNTPRYNVNNRECIITVMIGNKIMIITDGNCRSQLLFTK